jgi:3-phenylpropionate/trans-cinnamate dioxygenase ferredoxin reductase subunit
MLDAYALVVVGPLALMAGVVKAGAQGRLVMFADALGFAGLSLLALQIVVSGRWAAATRVFGLRSVLGLDLRTAPPRARAGVLALVGLLVLAGTSVWRRRLRINYERWRAVHLVCTALVLAAAFAHVVWVDAYTSVPVVRWSVLGIVVAAGVALCWTRVARPYSSALKPCRVLAAGDSCSPPGSASRQPSASCAPPPTPASRARCCCSTAAGTGRT